MRIVIDMQGAQTESRFRGIGRYTMSLVKAIVKQAKNHEIFLVLNATMPESIHTIRKAFDGLLPSNRIRIFEAPYSLDTNRDNIRLAEYLREYFLKSLEPDLVLITSLFEGPWANAITSINSTQLSFNTAVILYDLIPFIYQESYLSDSSVKSYYFEKINFLKKSNFLLAISESSRQEAIQYLQFPADKVVNISGATDETFIPIELSNEVKQNLLEKLNITKEFILFAPGGFDERKNFKRLLEAYSLLPEKQKQDYQLVIVGKLNQNQAVHLWQIAKQYDLTQENLIFTNYLPEDELISLYSLTKLFIFPSLHEGFGLPVLEAMACGAAVIASNSSSLPEVIGNPQALFDPLSAISISKKINEVLNDPILLEQLENHSKNQSKLFSWNLSAKTALHTIEENHNKLDYSTQKNSTLDLISEIKTSQLSIADKYLSAFAYAINFNQPRTTKHLFLDISTLVHTDARSGIQRVVRSLLSELLQQSCIGYQIYPIYFDNSLYRYANRFCQNHFNVDLGLGDTPVDFRQDDIYLSLDLNMHLTEQTKAVHTFLNEHGILLFFIVYDILPVKHPKWWKSENVSLFKNWLETIVELSTGLICISQSVADELQEWIKSNNYLHLNVPPTISAFHLGADIENSLPSKGLPSNAIETLHKIEKTTSFLMVGTVEPRKGYMQALNAFEILWRQGYDINLVIVGKDGWLADDLIKRLSSHPQKDNQLYWLKGISDEYLDIIYDKSTCLVAASEGEGFGLPLIEAAQHKIPIIARNLPVFREVAGDHAFYFDTTNPENLAQAIKDWLALHEKVQHPTSDTMPWLTWKDSAAQLVAAINLISGDHE